VSQHERRQLELYGIGQKQYNTLTTGSCITHSLSVQALKG